MKKLRLSALVMAGALSLSLLTACGGGEEAPEVSETPTVTESAAPSTAPEVEESAAPAESEAPAESQAPAASEAPAATPAPAESQVPAATPAPETPSAADPAAVVEAFWAAVSAVDQPELMDLDADLLGELYGIDAADLEAWLCKMPLMNTQATEFFFAKVKEGRMDAVKAALQARQAALAEQWKMYLPEQLELVENYKLLDNGSYVVFAISYENDRIPGIFTQVTG